jgi:hypothetical protein
VKKDFGKIFSYIQRTYQHLDFAASAKNFGDIQYLDMGAAGELQVSGKQKLEPEAATKVVDECGTEAGRSGRGCRWKADCWRARNTRTEP